MTLAFLLDVDNTLLDNDRVKDDLAHRIQALVGAERAARFWDLYEEVRQECDFVDFPRTLERFSQAYPTEPGYPHLCALILGYPFAQALFPDALEAIAHLNRLGTTAILSDGDPVYQPAKVARSGLADAVGNRVLVFAHKEQEFAEVQKRLPADHYVLIDDKPALLGAAKTILGDRLTTVLVCQGKYARLPEPPGLPPPDLEIDRIGDLRQLKAPDFGAG